MIENKLKVFSVLRAIIQKNPHDTKAYDCLKLMCESSIHSIESGTLDDVRFSRWELKSQVDGKLVAGNIDSKELQKWMDDRKLLPGFSLQVNQPLPFHQQNYPLVQWFEWF